MRFKILIALWFLAACTASAVGLTAKLRPPAPQVAIVALTALLVVAGVAWPAFRAWLDSLTWQSLAAIHLTRFVGFYFLWLYRQGQLPYGFAVPAGVGDIVVATLALALLLSAAAVPKRPWLLVGWNALGMIDILMVVARAALHGLRAPASMSPLLHLPLSLLATFLVPIIIASHFLLFQKARSIGGRVA